MCRLRILVVEDDRSWHYVIRHTLRSLPFECSLVIATDFESANKCLGQETFDLVTLDMALSEIEKEPMIPPSGWLLIDRLTKESPETRIIVISGTAYFQERPDLVADLLTKYGAEFLWKGNPDIQLRLQRIVTSVFQSKYSGTTESLEKLQEPGSEAEAVGSTISRPLAEYRQILSERFSQVDLRNLAFDLGVDYESLPGEGKADKARELILFFQHRDRLLELIEAAKSLRPHIPWP
jgi:CheY-like chemotaxis protein